MVYSFCQFEQCRVLARDGNIGWVRDVYIDDAVWAIRVLLVDTRGWLLGRKAFISGHHVSQIDLRSLGVRVDLTRSQVEGGRPDIDTGQLCAASEILGYRVLGSDGELGEISDLLFDPCSWSIRCLLVDTHADKGDGHVAIGSGSISAVDRNQRSLRTDLAQTASRGRAALDPGTRRVLEQYSDHSKREPRR